MRSALNTEYTQRQGLDFARYEIQRPSHAPPPRLAILLSLTAARRHLCLDPLHGTRSDAAFSQNGALKKRLDKPRYRAGPRNPRAVSARGGPTVRISLPPARSPLRNLMPTISAQPAEVALPPPKTLSPLQQCAHVRDRVGIAFQAVRILFGLQFNLQPDAVRIVEVEGLAIPPFGEGPTVRISFAPPASLVRT